MPDPTKKKGVKNIPPKSETLSVSLYTELCLGQGIVCKFIGRVDFFLFMRFSLSIPKSST